LLGYPSLSSYCRLGQASLFESELISNDRLDLREIKGSEMPGNADSVFSVAIVVGRDQNFRRVSLSFGSMLHSFDNDGWIGVQVTYVILVWMMIDSIKIRCFS
jgi:hypothetical protein